MNGRRTWLGCLALLLAAALLGSCFLVAPHGHWNPGDDQYDPTSDPNNSPDAPPVAPSHLAASAESPGQVSLSWRDNSSYEALFEVERKTGSGGTFDKIGEAVTDAEAYTDDTVASDTLYVYRVRAVSATAGDSTWSAEAEVRSVLALPEISVTRNGLEIPSGTGSYDFTVVLIGQSASATFRIENSGDAPLELGAGSSVTISGSGFAVASQPTGPVAPGDYTEFALSFTPTDETPRTGSVNIANNDANESPYTFSVTATGTYQYYTLTVQAGTGGTTDPSGAVSVAAGGARDIVATPSGGYVFSSWTVVSGTGAVFGNANLATTTVALNEGDATIKANFSLITTHTLTVQNDGNGTTTPTGDTTVDSGVPEPISATPSGGYYFVNWTVVSGSAAFADANAASTTVTLSTGDATIQANFGVIWEAATVDDGGSNVVGEYASIGLGSSGSVYVSYYDATQKKLKFAHYASSWTTETVTDPRSGGTGYGAWSSLVVDSIDGTHVSYYWTNGQSWSSKILRYGKWDGSSWTLADAATLGTPETEIYSSIALDTTEKPHIGYFYRHTSDGINYTYYVMHAYYSAAWSTQTAKSSFTSSADYFPWTSLALDSSDYAHLSYQTQLTGDLEYASYDGSSWTLVQPTSADSIGAYSSIALDSSGFAHVSCQNTTTGELIYYVYDGTWSAQDVVDTDGTVGAYTSLKLDSHGYPHISYYDTTNGDLKYAWEDGSGWHTETVDSGGNVGFYTSLALDSQDRAHIAYYDGTNTALKYAHRNVAP